MNGLALFTGNSNLQLAKSICDQLNIHLTDILVSRFSEGEIRVEIKENIRRTFSFYYDRVDGVKNNDERKIGYDYHYYVGYKIYRHKMPKYVLKATQTLMKRINGICTII